MGIERYERGGDGRRGWKKEGKERKGKKRGKEEKREAK